MSLDPGTDTRREPDWLVGVVAVIEATDLSPQSRRRLVQVISRFAGYLAKGHGVTDLHDATADQVKGFVGALGPKGERPASATMHFRRSAVRLTYRIARQIGLASSDPTLDLTLPPRSPMSCRLITEEEVLRCRAASLRSLGETRLPATWALAEAGARTSEIPAVRIQDLGPDHRSVFLHGGSKYQPRWALLTEWGALQVERRIRALRLGSADALLVYAGAGSPESRQASAATAIRTILVRAGLGDEPDLRPASVLAWAGACLFTQGNPIEEVARRLGMRSLDACATLIGVRSKDGR